MTDTQLLDALTAQCPSDHRWYWCRKTSGWCVDHIHKDSTHYEHRGFATPREAMEDAIRTCGKAQKSVSRQQDLYAEVNTYV